MRTTIGSEYDALVTAANNHKEIQFEIKRLAKILSIPI
jgi:hypothetical protein